ncbi:MAG: sulfate adenylyltransferase [Campylobacteraceae bacterium]|jgi:sulfate adenylyltransferase|nr:sulfate adenylyltransferase [Campylobacteraceae bacterium]
MAYKKDKQLFIDKEALFTLSLVEEGILHPVHKLMNKQEADEIEKSGLYKGKRFPMAVTFTPSGRHNQDTIKNAKKGEKINLVLDGKKRGEIIVDEVFEVDQIQKITKTFGAVDTDNPITRRLLKRLGNWAVSGDFTVEVQSVKDIKQQITDAKNTLGVQRVSAIMMAANPFHRAHERLLRITLEKSELLVIFLLKPYDQEGLLPFELRLKTLHYFVENYVHKNRILIIPFDNTYVYADTQNAVIDSIIAKNFGCGKLSFSEYYGGIGMYYDANRARTVLDDYDDLPDIDIVAKFVFCNECNTLVNARTCPHGTHHHIRYNSSSLLALLQAGILPPAVLMRKDISAIILSSIHPERFKNVTQIYEDLFPGTGLLETHNDEDFYIELMKLYQTTSLT